MCAEWLRIDLADPCIKISDLLLCEMLLFGTSPHVDLRPGPGIAVPGPPEGTSMEAALEWFREVSSRMEGWVLTVSGVNRTVVYRITGETPDGLAWYAEWPD
jgi:hypothetical protein